MKTKLLMIVSLCIVGVMSCKKETPVVSTSTKKSYTIEYKASCMSDDRTFTINYIQNGTTLTKTIYGTQEWSTSFTASTGDYVSMKCSPPAPGAAHYVSNIRLTILYNGTEFKYEFADGSKYEEADVYGALP